MRIGLATIQHGRRAHLARQATMVQTLAGLSRYLVVTMDGAPVPAGAERLDFVITDPDRLPLAAARNAAVAHLQDCELIVLLDVDCLPDSNLLTGYAAGAERLGLERTLLMGPVGWLDRSACDRGLDAVTIARARRTVKRTFPEHGVTRESRPELFWSLSCAISPQAFRRVGGFDETFAGWGAEDTDFGRRAVSCGLELWKVSGAWAYHQPHPPARGRPGQVAALAQNAVRFHARWGDWPMPDVLAELAGTGQILWSRDGSTLEVTSREPEPERASRR